MTWRKILIISIVVGSILTARIIAMACAYEWDVEYSRIFFFLPENSNGVNDRWWLQQTHVRQFDESPLMDTTQTLPEDIVSLCKEWNVLLGGNYSIEDISDVVFFKSVYEDDEITLLETARPSASKVLDAFKNNKELYDYLKIAKRMEFFSYYNPYDVTVEQLRKDSIEYGEICLQIEEKIESVKNNKALYEKYLYQRIRLGGASEKGTDYYYNEFRKVNQSQVLQGWGIQYYITNGGVDHKDTLQQYRVNILLAEVLQLSPGKKNRCLEIFYPRKNNDYIKQVSDPVLKANLLSMQAFYDYRPQMNYIAEIAKLHPNNVLLPDLLTREINKYEDYKFSLKYTGVEVLGKLEEKSSYENAFIELEKVLTGLSGNSNATISNKSFYTVALAHCKALSGASEEAIVMLDNLQTTYVPHKVQKLITKLYILSNQNLSEEKNLDRIADLVVEIYSLGRGSDNMRRCISSVFLKIHRQLMDKNETTLAGLFLLKSNMIDLTNNYFTDYTWYELNASHENFEELERLILKENKTKLEKLLIADFNIYNIYNSRAKVYLRENDLDNAILYLKRLPEWYISKEYNFLVETSIFFKEEKGDFRMLNILEALTLLNNRIRKAEVVKDDQQRAVAYLAIANAFYELSNMGEYCYTTGYYSTRYAPQSLNELKATRAESFYKFYYKAETAFAYYEKAKRLSRDMELSAAIQYWSLRAFDEIYDSTHDEQSPVDGWLEYLNLYENTNFYRLHSCPGIEDYRQSNM